jgi:transcriptional regulator with XRE-family HTH domain
MAIQHNYLQMHRKRSYLTQKDIAFLLNLDDHTNLSRYEKGLRSPNIETLLTYHILFDISIESFFPRQKQSVYVQVVERMGLLLLKLKARDKIPKTRCQISFLESTLTRLNNSK